MGFTNDDSLKQQKVRTDHHKLRSRETVKDIQTRAVSAMNTVHIDKVIDPKLYQFGAKSASTHEIEQKIKSHNYIMSLRKKDQSAEQSSMMDRFVPPINDKDSRPYTASALLNDKPQFRITTPNLLSTGNKQSLGDLLSDDQYRQELRQLEVVEDMSEDNPE